MTLNDRLKAARTAKGLTLDEVAVKVGVSRQTIQRYESGVISNIPSDNIEKLAAALDTTPAELMGWAGSPQKVTTTMTFDGDSPMHDLTQAYLRHPKAVQDEIIIRLEKLDVTFSRNVCKLLQASGDVNGFMQKTGLDFATVGKLMQGETVFTSPEKAERIAAYFEADIVKMFFSDCSSAEDIQHGRKDKTKPLQDKTKSERGTKKLQPGREENTYFIDHLDFYAKKIYFAYEQECVQNKRPRSISYNRVMRIISDTNFNQLMHRAIDILDGETPKQLNLDKIYSATAHALYTRPSDFEIWCSLPNDDAVNNLKNLLRESLNLHSYDNERSR